MQGAYIDKILVHFNMAEVNPVSTLLPKNIKLDDIQAQTKDPSMPYAKAIGSLMYAAIQTQPDIAFAVQHLSQYTPHPAQAHWATVKCILRYLKGTRDEGIVYKHAESTPRLEVYSNTD